MGWRDHGACRDLDPNWFVAPAGTPSKDKQQAHYDRARRFCNTCPVFDACKEHAIKRVPGGDVGIYAGMTPQERRAAARAAQAA